MDEFPQAPTIDFKANTKPLQSELRRVTLISDQFGRSLMKAFEGITLRGKGLADVVRSLGQDLARMAFRNAFKPLEQSLNSLFQSSPTARGGSGGSASGLRGLGIPIPFAQGGVVASPTYFPLAGGRAGVMGERGAEAILPLSRGPDGPPRRRCGKRWWRNQCHLQCVVSGCRQLPPVREPSVSDAGESRSAWTAQSLMVIL